MTSSSLRRSAVSLLHRSGYYGRKLTKLSRDEALVLLYHKVSDTGDARHDRSGFERGVSREDFESQMRFVRERMNPVSMTELVELLQQDRTPPPGLVAVTFDDAYRDNYEVAYPILKEYRIPATVFVATAFIESSQAFWWDQVYEALRRTKRDRLALEDIAPRRGGIRKSGPASFSLGTPEQRIQAAETVIERMQRMTPGEVSEALASLQTSLDVAVDNYGADLTMTWHQLREMSQNGISVESHTHGHPNLAVLPPRAVEQELRESKAIIEQKTARSVRGLAYPIGRYGMYTDATVRIAKSLGYRYACIAEPGTVRRGSDVYAIRRRAIGAGALPMFAHNLLTAYRQR